MIVVMYNVEMTLLGFLITITSGHKKLKNNNFGYLYIFKTNRLLIIPTSNWHLNNFKSYLIVANAIDAIK